MRRPAPRPPGLRARARAAALVAAALVAPGPARALQGFANGHLLSAWCTRDERIDVEACLSYLRGVFDTIAAVQQMRPSPDSPGRGDVDGICIPASIPVTQLRIVFNRYARENPDELAVQASVAVMRALRAEFPCGG